MNANLLRCMGLLLAHDDGYCVAAILPDLGSKPTLCGLSWNVRLQPRHASLIGGGPRGSSGGSAKSTAIRRASSRLLT
jgi:hypothetical protein